MLTSNCPITPDCHRLTFWARYGFFGQTAIFKQTGTISLWREVVCGLVTAAWQRGREALEKAYPEERHA
jgi:hypothetical protein